MINKFKKVLLVGANGFIGSFLHNRFNNDFSITSLGTNNSFIENNFFSINLSNESDVNNFVKNSTKFDALIFLVGLAHKKGKSNEFEEFKRINKQTLVNLLSSLAIEGKIPNKIIFSSTISVYGEKIENNSYMEYSPKEPVSPYAVTKLEAEEYLLRNYIKQSWILRFAPVYSPTFKLNINRRTKICGFGFKVGDGKKKLSLCNLENIGLAVQGILEGKVEAGIYNISDSVEYSYNDLLKHTNTKWTIRIPNFLIKGFYLWGEFVNNIFIKENATKLISSNIFPSKKIREFLNLPYKLDDNFNFKTDRTL